MCDRLSILTGFMRESFMLISTATLRKWDIKSPLSPISISPSFSFPSKSWRMGVRFVPWYTSSMWKPASFMSWIRYWALYRSKPTFIGFIL